MDQDTNSNPTTQASTSPTSFDDSTVNPAAASAPDVPTVSSTDASDISIAVPDSTAIDSPAPAQNSNVTSEVIRKISESQNVLVALSSDPSVDEMSAAIGLSLFLDRLGKRATAIYSGATPNALEFLKPEETFEPSVDTLQDFVIALNKEKADHLRYRLDGDYVKIFITPYKTRIGEEDLEFSYGDFNVDLVLALDVANGIDLDAALREHGRIMHDAVTINITTSNPGRFGEIEWSDKTASSVSEMIAKLLYDDNNENPIGKEEATAFLTGIVAATNRFSNAKTTPATMEIASRLMQSGANQQLISKNITPDVDNEIYSLLKGNGPKQDADPTKLDINHNEAQVAKEDDNQDETPKEPSPKEDSTLLDDLKAAEASLSTAGNEIVPDTSNQPVKLADASADTAAVETEINSNPNLAEELALEPASSAGSATSTVPPEQIKESSHELTQPTEPTLPPVIPSSDAIFSEPTFGPNPSEEGNILSDKPEKIVQPSPDIDLSSPNEAESERYGKMVEDAISNSNNQPLSPAPELNNPASTMAPQVPNTPEMNGIPEMNYMPLPDEAVLPPPPTPPIDMSAPAPEAPVIPSEQPIVSPEPVISAEPIQPAIPPVEPTPTPLGPQPAMQDQVYTPQASDPGAFKIPGM